MEIKDCTFKNCTSLEDVDLPEATSSLGDSCFQGCSSLKTAQLHDNVNAIGTSAFAGCTSLTSIDKLGTTDTSHPLSTVGEYAFAGTKLTSANLVLKSSIDSTWWGDYCFQNCRDLTGVSFKSSIYQSNYMFDGCTSLRRVDFDNGQNNYVGKHVFNNCTSLEEMTFSEKQFSILKGYFNGCSKLKKVGFKDYGENAAFNYLQKNAFVGCTSLTSLEFPQSLDNLSTQIEDCALSGCTALQEICFHGVNASEMFKIEEGLDEDLYYGKWYDFDTYPGDSAGIEKIDKLLNYIADKGLSACILFDQYYVDNVLGSREPSWSGERHYASQRYFNNESHQGTDPLSALCKYRKAIFIRINDWINKDMCDAFEASGELLSSNVQELRESAFQLRKLNLKNENYDIFCHLFNEKMRLYNANVLKAFILQKNGKCVVTIGGIIHGSKGVTRFSLDSKKVSSSYSWKDASQEVVDKIDTKYLKKKLVSMKNETLLQAKRCEFTNQMLMKNGFYRLNHDVKVKTKDYPGGLDYKHDASKVVPYVEKNEYPSDKVEKTSFVPGKWYYNAKEIKEYADEHGLPLLVLFSLETCTPCQAYKAKVHENVAFQQWIAKQKFLCCRIEAEKPKGYDAELRYCEDELSKNAQNFLKAGQTRVDSYNAFGDVAPSTGKLLYGYFNSTNFMPPAAVFYWKKTNGATVAYHDYQFHSLINIFSHPLLGVNKFIQLLKSLCLYHFDYNSLAGAKYVVDAEKEFNYIDYDIENDNPYLKASNLICIDSWSELEGKAKTSATVLAAIENVLKSLSTQSKQYPKYIGGCLFGDIDWIDKTFSMDIQGFDDASMINEELNKFYIQIDSKYYKMQVSSSDYKSDINTPCGIATLFKYSLNEVQYKAPDASTDTDDDPGYCP